MPLPIPHLPDEDLLALADGELSPKRLAEVRAHLDQCWGCRSRMADMQGAIVEFMRDYSSLEVAGPPVEGTAHLLRLRLEQKAARESSDKPGVSENKNFGWAWQRYAVPVMLVLASTGAWLLHSEHGNYAPGAAMGQADRMAVPEARLTPGAATLVSKSEVCGAKGRDGRERIPDQLKDSVFAEYGIQNPSPGTYEVDFLITPELGGATNIRNLWPEPYGTVAWNAHVKDALENKLHDLVCRGEIDLGTAQHDLATNWVDAYKKYFRTDKPI